MTDTTNKNSSARIKANNKYNEKAYDRINLAVSKGSKQAIQDVATSKCESVNGYIKNAIKAQIQVDTGEDIEL